MKCQDSSQPAPVHRLRLYFGAVVMVPLFMALMLVTTAGSLMVFLRTQIRLVQVAADGGEGPWQDVGQLPGTSEQIAAAEDGSLWVRTQTWGSLARFRDGGWEVYRRDTFGTERSTPRHDFVLVGNELWAAIDQRLVHFDGKQWQSLPIPNAAADHVVGADSKTAWVLGNDGILRTWRGGKWESSDLRATIAEASWKLEDAGNPPRLASLGEGKLWLCSRTVWRAAGGVWTPVKVAGQPLRRATLLGSADGKLWFDDAGDLVWVAPDAARSGRLAGGQLGLDGVDEINGVQELAGKVCGTGTRGIYTLEGKRWTRKWPAPQGVVCCQSAAVTNGRVWAIANYLTPVPALWLTVPVAAIISGGVLWFMRRWTHVRYRWPKGPSRRNLVVLILAIVAMAVASAFDVSAGILWLIAPVAAAMFILLVPPLVITMMAFRDLQEGSLEVLRFRPMTTAEMPAAARQWIEENTPDYQRLGLRPIGDFRLKERSEHFGRGFINEAGDILGEIAWARPLPWRTRKCCSFYSVTDDSTYLETGNLALPNETFERPFLLQSVPGGSVAETLDAHRRELERLVAEGQTKPLCFVAEDAEKVCLYGQKLCYQRLKARGVISSDPYEDVAPALGTQTSEDAAVGVA